MGITIHPDPHSRGRDGSQHRPGAGRSPPLNQPAPKCDGLLGEDVGGGPHPALLRGPPEGHTPLPPSVSSFSLLPS